MAQFDVYTNLNPVTKRTIPYLLDIQTDLLNNLTTRVVIPLYSVSAMGKACKRGVPNMHWQRAPDGRMPQTPPLEFQTFDRVISPFF